MLTEQDKKYLDSLKQMDVPVEQAISMWSMRSLGFGDQQKITDKDVVINSIKNKDEDFMSRFAGDLAGDIRETGKGIRSEIKDASERFTDSTDAQLHGEQTIFETLGQGALNALGVVGGVITQSAKGLGKAALPQKAEDAVSAGARAVGEKVAETVAQSEFLSDLLLTSQEEIEELKKTNPRLARNMGALIEGISGATEVATAGAVGGAAVPAAKAVKETAVLGIKKATEEGTSLFQNAARQLNDIEFETGIDGIQAAEKLGLDPDSIMQRVARVSKKKQSDFEAQHGTSIGKYLVDREVFGNPDEIADQLFKRFKQSKKAVDDALAGVTNKEFKNPAVGQALKELKERETSISAPGAKSADLERVVELQKKHNGAGLTLSEVNDVKRIYERNIKVDYMRENLPTKVAAATNLDNAIRTFQFNEASKAGFKNLPQLNKETQMAKQLMDALGAEAAGSAGNNAVGLTDWLILSEATTGGAGAASAFLGKKALSSARIQSEIAKRLSSTRDKVGFPEAEIDANVSSYLEFLNQNKGTDRGGHGNTKESFSGGEIPPTTNTVDKTDLPIIKNKEPIDLSHFSDSSTSFEKRGLGSSIVDGFYLTESSNGKSMKSEFQKAGINSIKEQKYNIPKGMNIVEFDSLEDLEDLLLSDKRYLDAGFEEDSSIAKSILLEKGIDIVVTPYLSGKQYIVLNKNKITGDSSD